MSAPIRYRDKTMAERRGRTPLPVTERLRVAYPPAPCKDCEKQPRESGSSRCMACSQKPKLRQKIERKVEKELTANDEK